MKIELKADTSAIGELNKGIDIKVQKSVDSMSITLRNYLITRHLTGGTTDDRLGRRTGNLASSVNLIPTGRDGDLTKGGVEVNSIYASVHIGPRGQQTVIRPKRSAYLTIPVGPAKTRTGRAKVNKARDVGLDFLKSKKGTALLVKKNPDGSFTPWYVLKRSVTIKARVHPEDINEALKPQLEKQLVNDLVELSE